MIRDYDQAVQRHYQNVAETAGLLSSSTMADLVTRERETQAILQFLERSLGRRRAEGDRTRATNMLSTPYYAARVLHPVASQDRGFKRNSEFVRFLSDASKPDVGDYSPLKLHLFDKIGSS